MLGYSVMENNRPRNIDEALRLCNVRFNEIHCILRYIKILVVLDNLIIVRLSSSPTSNCIELRWEEKCLSGRTAKNDNVWRHPIFPHLCLTQKVGIFVGSTRTKPPWTSLSSLFPLNFIYNNKQPKTPIFGVV